MKKDILIVLLLTTLSNGAIAQDAKPNPFTGRGAAMESLMVDLERAKIESAIANEKLALSKAKAEEKRLGSPDSRASAYEPSPVFASSVSPRNRLPVATAMPRGTSMTALAADIQAPLPKLIGTAETPNGWVAMVYVPALKRVINLPDGVIVDGFCATSVGPGSAHVNGQPMQLSQNVTARIAMSEGNSTIATNAGRTLAAPPAQMPVFAAVAAPTTAPIDLPIPR